MADIDPTKNEPHPNPQALTFNQDDPAKNTAAGVDYEPHPSQSIRLPESRQKIVDKICRLYSNGASEENMQVYAEKAIYDDPFSFCDTRYKIAGQWYGLPKIMSSSKTIVTEIVSNTDKEIVFKLRQEYRPILTPSSKTIDSLVSLLLENVNGEEKVVYHKDMWNGKDYSHEGLGKLFKTLNGDHLPKITQPPETL